MPAIRVVFALRRTFRAAVSLGLSFLMILYVVREASGGLDRGDLIITLLLAAVFLAVGIKMLLRAISLWREAMSADVEETRE